MTQHLSVPRRAALPARTNAQYRQRITELTIEAEAQRLAFGSLTDDYLRAIHPFDRVYVQATDMIRARPLTTTALLGVAGIATVIIGKRLPRLPLRGLIRGITLATVVLRGLRRPAAD